MARNEMWPLRSSAVSTTGPELAPKVNTVCLAGTHEKHGFNEDSVFSNVLVFAAVKQK